MKRSSCLIYLLVFTSILPLQAQFSEGTDFWVGFMEHVDVEKNTKVLMITSGSRTSGTVEVPMKGWKKNFSVSPDEVTFVKLPKFVEAIGSEWRQETGVRVRSRQPISVYAHQYANSRSEAALVLPVASLDDEYYVMSYKGYKEQEVAYPSEFLIVAVSHDTQVEIIPRDFTKKNRPPGSLNRITLNRGETFQVQGRDENVDLTGSYVRANKPFALFSGNKWTQIPGDCLAPDNLYEQMYPISAWGTETVAVPSLNADYDLIRIMASSDYTEIRIDGIVVATLNAGDYLKRRISSQPIYIKANKPILAAQYNISHECNNQAGLLQGDPSMLLLNNLMQSTRMVTFFSSPFEKISTHYVNLVTRSSDKGSITLDGKPVSGFKSVPGNSDYAYAQLKVVGGKHRLEADGCGLIAYSYGYGQLESYAYATGTGFRLLDENPIPEGGCLSDTFLFNSQLKPEVAKTIWDFGDGQFSLLPTANHHYNRPGNYKVELIMHNLCLDVYDTISSNLRVNPPIKVQTIADTVVCAGDWLQLTASQEPNVVYHWSGPNEFYSNQQNPTVFIKDTTMTGTYTVVATSSSCYSIPNTTRLTVHDPQPNLGEDTTLCPGDGFTLSAGSGKFTHFAWQDGSIDSTFYVTESGTYWLATRDDYGCIGRDSIWVDEKCPASLYTPFVFSPNGDGRNDFFRVKIDIRVVNYELKIFDMKGGQVFKSRDPRSYWDGKRNGKEAPEGVYVWRVEFNDPTKIQSKVRIEQSGQMMLVR